jgi:RNA polymerase sigma-70 factor, ECF subfamily
LTEAIDHAMMPAVSAPPRPRQDRPDGPARTLGDVLYAAHAPAPPAEKDWLRLVNSIAAGDQDALHELFEHTHRIVFTLLVRITGNRAIAEELTLDVFTDIWRRASTYEPARGSVVGWVMNQARARASETSARRPEEARALRQALPALTPEERQAIETVLFSQLAYGEAAAVLAQPVAAVKAHVGSGLRKLQAALDRAPKGR